MRANNPTKDPAVLAKMSASLKGRTFLARGGNGKVTEPQMRLATALGWPMEVAVLTGPVQGQFPSLPNHYKVDVGSVKHKLAVEVDGNSHKTKKWKFLDRRKEAILAALGWRVLRFWNEEVMADLDRCVQMVLSTISK